MLNWLKSKPQEPMTLGQIGEEIAQGEYKKQGFKIIAKNEYNKKGKRLGEIDFIGELKDKIIFVEVKIRVEDKGRFGTAIESVDHFKQIKILKAVKMFLLKHQKYTEFKPQIDVCVIKITDFSRLQLVSEKPNKYIITDGIDPVRGRSAFGTASAAWGRLTSNGVDKIPYYAKIIANAVEDWG